MKLVLGPGDICLHCFMKNLFKKQSAKFVQNPSSFTIVMAKHILVFFYAPQCKLVSAVYHISQSRFKNKFFLLITLTSSFVTGKSPT